ncbi:MAG: GNAT family N-acetyltransferase [Bacillota bacterium]
MELQIIHNRKAVYEFLSIKKRYDYIYQFNNLEEKNWNNVICFGLFDKSYLKEIAMLNINYGIPVLLAAGFDNIEYSVELLKRLKPFLPNKLYTHIDKQVLDNVFDAESIDELEEYMNMGLDNYNMLEKNCSNQAIRLGADKLNDIKALMKESYPEAWLDDELVSLNENFGIYLDGKLISFAGIHAYSEEYQVAAVAHVTTHPFYRNKGYAEKTTNALLNSLKDRVKFIGLNVRIENHNAIKCYKKLGFTVYGKFAACRITNK